MKAHGIQHRTTSGARQSGADDWHSQSGPSHGPVLRVGQAQGRLGRHGGKEDRRAWNGQVGPKASLGLGHA
eukprot:15019670-Alexandrium_andersonii.AAC.1